MSLLRNTGNSLANESMEHALNVSIVMRNTPEHLKVRCGSEKSVGIAFPECFRKYQLSVSASEKVVLSALVSVSSTVERLVPKWQSLLFPRPGTCTCTCSSLVYSCR